MCKLEVPEELSPDSFAPSPALSARPYLNNKEMESITSSIHFIKYLNSLPDESNTITFMATYSYLSTFSLLM